MVPHQQDTRFRQRQRTPTRRLKAASPPPHLLTDDARTAVKNRPSSSGPGADQTPADTDPQAGALLATPSAQSLGDVNPAQTPWGRTSRRTPPTETLRIQGWFQRSGRKPLVLGVVAGRTALKRTVLHPEWLMQSALTLGSRAARQAAFQYDEEGVAPVQCRIAFTRGDYHLEILDESAQTSINGMTIRCSHGAVRIQPGDVLALGADVRIRFETAH